MIRAAGLLILNAEGKVLFVQRSAVGDSPGLWAFPGGKREGEESAEETAIREAEEEIGRTFKKDQLKFWTRSCRPQEYSPFIPNQSTEDVDFTTFLVKETEEFIPVLGPAGAPEHTGFAWADLTSPPSPLHPGCQIALRRFSMDDELQIAEAIRDGELVSPQEYGNIHLFAFRISGVGTAIRGEKKDKDGKVTQKAEVVYRKPEDYTSQEFLTRAQGLPIIILHPEEAILNTKQFAERVIGAIMITYLRPAEDGSMEPWGVARIYDRDAAIALCTMDLSTSPGVLLGKDVRTLTLDGGTQVVIEGKPSLLDHLAICERGVWDKGGDPTGVDNIHTRADEDNMAKIELKRINAETDEHYNARVKEAEGLLARADSVVKGDEGKLDKLIEGIGGLKDVVTQLKARVDAVEEKEKKDEEEEVAKKKADAKGRVDKFEFPKKDDDDDDDKFKKKMDAAEKACADAMMEAGEPEEMAADAAKKRRKDAEDIDAKEKAEAKEKADAEEKEKDAKKDAQTVAGLRDKVAELENQIKGALVQPKDEDRAKLLQAQARFDSAFTALGTQCRAPLLGETLHQFRLDNLRALQKHSPEYKDKPLELLAVNDSLLEMAETKIIADAITAARNPTDIATGTLIMRSRQDGGHTYNEWYGESAAWMRPIAGPVGLKGKASTGWINPNPGARR